MIDRSGVFAASRRNLASSACAGRLVRVECSRPLQTNYSHGPVVIWPALLAANIHIWTVLGVVVALGKRARTRLVWFACVCVVVCAYVFWISGSGIATLTIPLILVVVYLLAGEQPFTSDA